MGDHDITNNESLQCKLNRYKLQYKGEYRRRCEIESELNSITNLLRVTNEKLKTALAEGAKQKSTIRYLESQINMDKSLSLDTLDLSLSLSARSTRATLPRTSGSSLPSGLRELLMRQQTQVRDLVKRLQKQNHDLVNIKNILNTVMWKEARTATEKELPHANDSINTTTTNVYHAKPNNASSSTSKSSQSRKVHCADFTHGKSSTLTRQPSNRPQAAPRSMTASDTRPRVKKNEQLSNKETKTNPSTSKQTEAGHRETRTCPACSRQFAKSLDRSGYEQHFINCVDNLCQQATVWNSDTLALSVDRNANYNVLPAPKHKPKTGASVTALVEENKVCPACNIKFGNDIEQSEFERHVLACVEKLCQQEVTSGAAAGGDNLSHQRRQASNDKICPMCESRFPADTDQLVYERHVLAHFEDERNSG